MSDLISVSAEKHLVLYNAMCGAVGACHHVDECKSIIDKSVALAAYAKQVQDQKTLQMFNEVRLRAWRRIGELFADVDVSKCLTQTDKIKAVRAAFDPAALIGITDSRIREILNLTEVSDADFETALKQPITGSISDLMTKTPAYQDMVRRNQAASAASAARPTVVSDRDRAANAEAALNGRHVRELTEASNAAMKEIGITLERKDRLEMMSVVFLIKREVHAVLRQAAFDNKVTMQEVLRRGLRMWLIAHGYSFPKE